MTQTSWLCCSFQIATDYGDEDAQQSAKGASLPGAS